MNPIEHYNIANEDIEGILFGQVIQNDDPDKLNRIKVRIRGIFESPIMKEHIPWAVPVINAKVPELGSEVAVMFMRSDIERPMYMPEGFLDKKNIERLIGVYEAVITTRKSAVKTGISAVTGSFDEPQTTATAEFTYSKHIDIMSEDVAMESAEDVNFGEPQKAVVTEREITKGSERWSVTHVTGSFIEIHPTGDMVMHGITNVFYIIEGNHNEYAIGNRLSKVDGEYLIEAGGGMTIKVGGTELVFNAAGTHLQITGLQLQVDGLAVPPSAGKGPFCALSNCVFSGTIHTGNISVNN